MPHFEKTNALPSERSFAYTFAAVFGLSAWYLHNDTEIALGLLAFASFFLIFGFFKPGIFETPNLLWFKLGMFLGAFVSPIVLGLLYFSIVLATKAMLVLMKKDTMKLKLLINRKSNWQKAEIKNYDFENMY